MEGGTPAMPQDNRGVQSSPSVRRIFFNGQDARWPHSQDGCAYRGLAELAPTEKAFQRLKVIS